MFLSFNKLIRVAKNSTDLEAASYLLSNIKSQIADSVMRLFELENPSIALAPVLSTNSATINNQVTKVEKSSLA